MKKQLKNQDGSSGDQKNSSGSQPGAKLLSKRSGSQERKSKQAGVADMGVIDGNKNSKKEHNDSFEKYYNKDLDLDEDQVPVVIYELNESAINFISQESYEKALILLQKAQTMLDQIQAAKNQNDKFVFLLTLHNMALCFQKLGVLDECASTLEQCLSYLQSDFVQDYFNDPNQPALKLKMLKYKCKTHMQICALLSQVHKHKEAALHANQAIKISHFLIHDTESLCSYYTNELIQKKPLDEVSLISNFAFSLLEKTSVKLLPIFQTILKRIAIEDDLRETEGGVPCSGPLNDRHPGRNKTTLPQQTIQKQIRDRANARLGSGQSIQVGDADMKNILGYLNQNEWIYSLNIGNIMQIAPLTLQDFMSSTAIQIELSREFVLEKLCFLAVSYFCMGTEFRFLHQLNETIEGVKFQRKDSEYWHGKAVELAISFLPSESPLVSHILMSYEKHHSPSNMAIPEEDVQDVKVRVVRQIIGIDSNRLQPIIRNHADTEYRVQQITLTPLDYPSIFNKGTSNSLTSFEAQQRRRNLENKKALTGQQSQYAPSNSNVVANQKSEPRRPNSKIGSQPQTSKTVSSQNKPMLFAHQNNQSGGQPAPGAAGTSSTRVNHQQKYSRDGLTDQHHHGHQLDLQEEVLFENEPQNSNSNAENVRASHNRELEGSRERNLHSKKHRRQLLSPPSGSGHGGIQNIGQQLGMHAGNLTNTAAATGANQGTGDMEREFMKLEDQKALTQKKAKRLYQNNAANQKAQGAQPQGQATSTVQEFNTLSQHMQQRKSDGLNGQQVESDNHAEGQESSNQMRTHSRGGTGSNRQRPQTQVFEDIEIKQAKERQRSSELGISNKYHRRLQTSMITKNGVPPVHQDQSKVKGEGVGTNSETADGQFMQERRARSSLSNRNHSGNTKKRQNKTHKSDNQQNLEQVGDWVHSGLNSSQPIIIPKNQHTLELNTNLRGINKNRSMISDQMTVQGLNNATKHNGTNSFTLDMPGHQTTANTTNKATAEAVSLDRVQSRSQNKRSTSQSNHYPSNPNQRSSSRRFQQQQPSSQANDESGNQGFYVVSSNQEVEETGSMGLTNLEILNTQIPNNMHQAIQGRSLGQRGSSSGGANQKGAAPITDIRSKRQAATLNVDESTANRPNKKFVELSQKGNGQNGNVSGQQQMTATQALQHHQQQLLNQYTKQGVNASNLLNQHHHNHHTHTHTHHLQHHPGTTKGTASKIAASDHHIQQQHHQNQQPRVTTMDHLDQQRTPMLQSANNATTTGTTHGIQPTNSTLNANSNAQSNNHRASSQAVAHSGSRSSKNALGMTNLAALNQSVGANQPGSKSGQTSSKRKVSKKMQNVNQMYSSAGAGAHSNSNTRGLGGPNSALTHDQITYLLQAKREKLNSSQLVQGGNGFDDLNNTQPITLNNTQLPPGSQNGQSAQAKQIAKMIHQRRTPTALTGVSHDNIPNVFTTNTSNNTAPSAFNQTQGPFVSIGSTAGTSVGGTNDRSVGQQHKSASSTTKDKKQLRTNHQAILNAHLNEGLQGLTNASSKHHMFKTNMVVPGNLHHRAGSQIAVHNNVLLTSQVDPNTQNQMPQQQSSNVGQSTINQINRKSSIEAKMGVSLNQPGAATAVQRQGQQNQGGIIGSDLGNHQGQIRSKAQYDNWLQLQAMKKATGSNVGRSTGGSSHTSTKASVPPQRL